MSDYFAPAPPPEPDPEPCGLPGLPHDHESLCHPAPAWEAWRDRQEARALASDGTAALLAALDRDEPAAVLTLDQAARATCLDEVYAIVARHGAVPHTAAELVTLADYVLAGCGRAAS
jgi:hypothetical protein